MARDDDLGCRCCKRGYSTFRRVLFLFGAITSVGLFCLGFMMVFLPTLRQLKYSPGQTLASITQGLAIMLFSSMSFLESVYASRWVRRYFGFLTYTSGRLAYYITIGLYALPILEGLKEAHEAAYDGEGDVSVLEVLAFIGIIFTFLTAFLHLVYLCYRCGRAVQGDQRGEKKVVVKVEQQAPPQTRE